MPLVSSGVEHGNLRELALARMKDLGTQVNHNVFKLMFLPFMTITLLRLVALSYLIEKLIDFCNVCFSIQA